jgi:16S rRNA (uracil1498-N3)-methyltransferase
MRIPRLYIDLDLSTGKSVILPQDKAHHISHVLRMRAGDTIKLFNNSGNEYSSEIIELTKKRGQIEIGECHKLENESPLEITLCLAIARGQHMDFSIQKAVELGVKKIIPLTSEFSNVKLHENRIQNKLTHWQNIIINATEQCGRGHLTELQLPMSFSEWLDLSSTEMRLILHPGSQSSMSEIILNDMQVTLMVGPEGGFSDFEFNEAKQKGCVPVSLGPRILRTETAVVSALSNVQQLWGDLK